MINLHLQIKKKGKCGKITFRILTFSLISQLSRCTYISFLHLFTSIREDSTWFKMRVFWIVTVLCTFYFASGFNPRRIRQADPFTDQLELKLLRSDAANAAAKEDEKIPNAQGELTAYSLPHTFIIKQTSPFAPVKIINIRVSSISIYRFDHFTFQPLQMSLAPSFRADVAEDDDMVFEENIEGNSNNSVEATKLDGSMEENSLEEDNASEKHDEEFVDNEVVATTEASINILKKQAPGGNISNSMEDEHQRADDIHPIIVLRGGRHSKEHDSREHSREHHSREHDSREHHSREHHSREHDSREHDSREHHFEEHPPKGHPPKKDPPKEDLPIEDPPKEDPPKKGLSKNNSIKAN